MVLSTRVAAGGALVPLALGAAAGSAGADVGGRPIGLVPDKPTKPEKGGSQNTAAAVAPGYSYRCAESGTLRRAANSYVLGWCVAPNMHIDISSNVLSSGYQNGWGEGNYQNCGWFFSNIHPLVREGVFDHNCGNATNFPESYFGQAFNNTPNDDGSSAPVLKNCDAYQNVKPWANNGTGYNKVGTLTTGHTFKWRYKSKYGNWVLGRVIPAIGGGGLALRLVGMRRPAGERNTRPQRLRT